MKSFPKKAILFGLIGIFISYMFFPLSILWHFIWDNAYYWTFRYSLILWIFLFILLGFLHGLPGAIGYNLGMKNKGNKKPTTETVLGTYLFSMAMLIFAAPPLFFGSFETNFMSYLTVAAIITGGYYAANWSIAHFYPELAKHKKPKKYHLG